MIVCDHALPPEAFGGEPRALGEGAELKPGDSAVDGAEADERAEPAVGAGDDALPARDVGEPADALRHQARMLQHVRLHVDDAGDEDLVVGDRQLAEVLPLVLVPGVGGLEPPG